MMQHIRRSAISTRSRWSSVSKSHNEILLQSNIRKPLWDVGLPKLSAPETEITSIQDSARRLSAALRSGFVRQYTADTNNTIKDVLGPNGFRFQSPFHLMENNGTNTMSPFSRSFASRATRQSKQTQSEAKKDVATVEDPFDAPTYNIPEKPVTFTEGASYSVVILAGLAVAAAAAYAVFKELIFEPKEYKIFNKALKRIQDDSQVRVRIGTPITGYGQESRNRAARQRIPNRVHTDENGVERVEVNFYIRGPHGAGKVFTEMFKDNEDKQWKFTYLIVEILSPSPQQLILESYLPA